MRAQLLDARDAPRLVMTLFDIAAANLNCSNFRARQLWKGRRRLVGNHLRQKFCRHTFAGLRVASSGIYVHPSVISTYSKVVMSSVSAASAVPPARDGGARRQIAALNMIETELRIAIPQIYTKKAPAEADALSILHVPN